MIFPYSATKQKKCLCICIYFVKDLRFSFRMVSLTWLPSSPVNLSKIHASHGKKLKSSVVV